LELKQEGGPGGGFLIINLSFILNIDLSFILNIDLSFILNIDLSFILNIDLSFKTIVVINQLLKVILIVFCLIKDIVKF
jgi:hypothetical protein